MPLRAHGPQPCASTNSATPTWCARRGRGPLERPVTIQDAQDHPTACNRSDKSSVLIQRGRQTDRYDSARGSGVSVVREAEFAALFAGRVRAIRRTAYLLCGDWHHAEDLTQTAFAKLYAAWARLKDPG